MRYLFSAAGQAVLNAFVSHSTLFAFDLDGTLAPIVEKPAGIMIKDQVRECLIQLNSVAPVVIITGRSRADALHHLGFNPSYLVGNHGAEGLPGEEASVKIFAQICREWKKQLHLLLPDMYANGISLEDKGQTIAIHYRQASAKTKTRKIILAAIDHLTPVPRTVSGIFVENIAPRCAPHKGAALEALMRHLACQRAIFVGDDITDEDVFSLGNPDVMGIRVEKDPQSTAGFCLQGQNEILRLLNNIITLLNDSVSLQVADPSCTLS